MIPFPAEGNSAVCVGTVFFRPNEREPSQGRLLLITAESDATTTRGQWKKNSEMNINGCVYALAHVNGLLAASIGSSVSVRLFRFSSLNSELFQVSVYKVDTAGFQKVAHWNHSYLVTSLVSRESRLFVGDAICSVSVIDVIGTDGGEVRLESIARDFSPLWPMSIGSVDHDTMIGANVSLPPYFTKQTKQTKPTY